MNCSYDGCAKTAEDDSDICFRHRVMGVSIKLQGSAQTGSGMWNKTKNDWMLDNFGTTDDRELGKRGIERAPA
jgi:hypothetical protein